jgi:tRNA pseudouridine55 synthase
LAFFSILYSIFFISFCYNIPMSIPRYVVIEKRVGETPLEAMEAWRYKQGDAYADLPLAYAGRLDPLASGKLLILIGDTCKVQEQYHKLDKTYEFSILFGVGSDTGDVMGRLTPSPYPQTLVTKEKLNRVLPHFCGEVKLPFPVFSSRTVKGKPLHTWAIEGRLNEIEIPVQTSSIHTFALTKIETKMRAEVVKDTLQKINSIPPVTDTRKALGNDFRRSDIRVDWDGFKTGGAPSDRFTIAHFKTTVSSGTYIRSLAPAIGHDLGIPALAYHIHRTHIGHFVPLPLIGGFWRKQF